MNNYSHYSFVMNNYNLQMNFIQRLNSLEDGVQVVVFVRSGRGILDIRIAFSLGDSFCVLGRLVRSLRLGRILSRLFCLRSVAFCGSIMNGFLRT